MDVWKETLQVDELKDFRSKYNRLCKPTIVKRAIESMIQDAHIARDSVRFFLFSSPFFNPARNMLLTLSSSWVFCLIWSINKQVSMKQSLARNKPWMRPNSQVPPWCLPWWRQFLWVEASFPCSSFLNSPFLTVHIFPASLIVLYFILCNECDRVPSQWRQRAIWRKVDIPNHM